jgi:hypothetical protein
MIGAVNIATELRRRRPREGIEQRARLDIARFYTIPVD